MRKIRIGLSTPRDFKLGSAIIKLRERTKWSHTFIVMEGRKGSSVPFDKVFEASYGDVHCLTYENFQEQNEIFLEKTIEISDERYAKVATWLWDQLQKPYGYHQLFKIGLNIQFGSQGDDAYICTELVGKMLEDYLSYDISKSLDYIGMNDIYEIINEL